MAFSRGCLIAGFLFAVMSGSRIMLYWATFFSFLYAVASYKVTRA